MRLQYRQDGAWLDQHPWNPVPAEAIMWRVLDETGRIVCVGSQSQCELHLASFYNKQAANAR